MQRTTECETLLQLDDITCPITLEIFRYPIIVTMENGFKRNFELIEFYTLVQKNGPETVDPISRQKIIEVAFDDELFKKINANDEFSNSEDRYEIARYFISDRDQMLQYIQKTLGKPESKPTSVWHGFLKYLSLFSCCAVAPSADPFEGQDEVNHDLPMPWYSNPASRR